MKLSRCPVCHSTVHLLNAVEDEAAKELLTITSRMDTWLVGSILQYIGLFKPAASDLNNSRALRLIKETLSLHDNQNHLANCCDITVQSIWEKRRNGETVTQFKNHRYLKRVLEGTELPVVTVHSSRGNLVAPAQQPQQAPRTASAKAIGTLEDMKYD